MSENPDMGHPGWCGLTLPSAVTHVGEFEGAGRGMLVAPGTHQIRIALPIYQTFEADINPIAHQNVEVKTDLVKNGAPLAGPLVE
jgi:hypothetical protein